MDLFFQRSLFQREGFGKFANLDANSARGASRRRKSPPLYQSAEQVSDFNLSLLLKYFLTSLRRREMVARMKTTVDPFHWPQFISANEEFAKNTVREALDREASQDDQATRDVRSYMITRRETIGTRPCLVLMRSTRRLYIPDQVLDNEVVAEMENYALDMVYIANVSNTVLLHSRALITSGVD